MNPARELFADNAPLATIVGEKMGCIKNAYHIRRVSLLIEKDPDYPVDKNCHIAAEMIGASEWDAEMISLLMTHCPGEAIAWAKSIIERTRRQAESALSEWGVG